MNLLLGATADLDEGRSQHDHPAPAGRTGAFPLHAVPAGTQQALCGAPVRVMLDASWPPAQEARCAACEERLADDSAEPGDQGRSPRPGPRIPDDTSAQGNVSPFGEP